MWCESHILFMLPDFHYLSDDKIDKVQLRFNGQQQSCEGNFFWKVGFLQAFCVG